MDAQVESKSSIRKVYVAVGNDRDEGLKTLDWALTKWKSNISTLFILHLPFPDFSTNVVHTLYGKLPANSMSEEKLQVVRKYEEKKNEKLVSEYIGYCAAKGVKAKVVKVENTEEAIEKVMVDLISKLRVSTLVIGISFLKSSPSWKKTRNTIGAVLYMVEKRPRGCKMFIVCGGRLVRMRGGEGEKEDDEGNAIPYLMNCTSNASSSSSLSWLGRLFSSRTNSNIDNKRPSSAGEDSRDWWDAEMMEMHLQELLLMAPPPPNPDLGQQQLAELHDQTDHLLQQLSNPNLSGAEKTEMVRSKIKEAWKAMELKREEAEDNAERCAKADWAISLCNSRVADLESKITEEAMMHSEMSKKLEADRERSQELKSDIEETKNKVDSNMELQSELSNRLQLSVTARSHAEVQLQKSAEARAEVVREIEELRQQRDVLRRRIDFCKEKDAIGMVMNSGLHNISYREYTAQDIQSATDGFSDDLRLKSGGDGRSNVYRGRISHKTVAVKLFGAEHELSNEAAFLGQVKFLNNVRHPHLVAPMGFCTKLQCIVFEYMHQGSLKHNLLNSNSSSQSDSGSPNQTLKWHHRIRVAHQVCSVLAFLHSAKPNPIVHGKLSVSKILLDRNLVPKLCGLKPTTCSSSDARSDIRALGVILLHLLMGRKWGELVDDRMSCDRSALVEVLDDEMDGPWPLDMADELAGIAMRCLSLSRLAAADLSIAQVLQELQDLRKKSDDLVVKFGRQVSSTSFSRASENDDDTSADIPSFFICPILKDVMENPHVAEDGFSYELEAMEQWLQTGRDTSPMTNLSLNHTFLIPNRTLRSLIADWHSKRNHVPSSS